MATATLNATATKIKPLGDRALVRPVEREEVSKGGVVLPDTAKEKPQEAVVVAVGSGRVLDSGQRVPMPVAEGNRVLYAKYAGSDLKVDGVEHVMLSERDILAIVEATN